MVVVVVVQGTLVAVVLVEVARLIGVDGAPPELEEEPPPPPPPVELGVVGFESGMRVKVAVTETLEVRLMTQDPVPEQPSPQPEKVEPVPGVVVRVTEVPEVMAVEVQVEPQLIPPTLEVITPVPVPDVVTETV